MNSIANIKVARDGTNQVDGRKVYQAPTLVALPVCKGTGAKPIKGGEGPSGTGLS